MASPVAPGSSPTRTLADRIVAVRRRRFVGRANELETFRRAVAIPDPPFAVLFVYGPGGIGKTTLLGEYRHIAGDNHRLVISIDGRSCEPTPPGFLDAIARELGLPGPEQVTAHLASRDDLVLFIDTYEVLRPLDGWLRNQFLPRLPASALTVIAGRGAPDIAWRSSPGWADLIEIQPLRNLDPADSRAYLAAREVPGATHESVLAFTHGHPLALSLVGDVVARSASPFAPDRQPDVVASLLEHFIEHEPSPIHRQALEVCAHARVTTEGLLARVFGEDAAPGLFTWLCGLSFIEHDRDGVFPHDLAREILSANLRWRHPVRFREIHRAVHDYSIERVRSTQGREQFAELYSLMYLHRDNPSWQQFAETDRYGHEYLEPATQPDHPEILEMIQHHEGGASAEIAAAWLDRQPQAFKVLRDVHGEITGMVAALMIGRETEQSAAFDPVVARGLALVANHLPTTPPQEILCVRWCLGRDAYRTPATRTHFAMVGASIVYTHPHLAWGLFPSPDPDYWAPIFDYLCFRHYPGFEVALAGREWTFYGTNFREMPIEEIDTIMVDREISLSPVLGRAAPAPTTLMMLPEADFRQAVRRALRDFHRPDALAANPLRHSRLVGQHDGDDPVDTLRALLLDAAGQLDAGPRTRRYLDALRLTWFEPARTQEAAAEALDLPFSTYRRYLAAGVDHVASELWRRELAAGTPR